MAAPDKLKALTIKRADALDELPAELFRSIESAQRDAYSRILKLMNQLQTNAKGQIIGSVKNVSMIEQIAGETRNVFFEGEYLTAVREFAEGVDKQADFIGEYMADAFGSFSDREVFQDILAASKEDVLRLLDEQAVDQALINPIRSALQSSISGNATLADTIESLQQLVIGDGEKESNLLGNRKTLVRDAFAESDRRYSQIVESEYEFDFYRYAGGTVEDTRCFCQQRVNQYYHREEIEAWGRGEDIGACKTKNGWQGRKSGTNARTIFIYVGGYNCNHVLVAVPEEAVPESAKEKWTKKEELAEGPDSTDDWDEAQELQGKWRATLSEDQVEALERYTANGYGAYNQKLRNGTYPFDNWSAEQKTKLDSEIAAATSALESGPKYKNQTFRVTAFKKGSDDGADFDKIMQSGNLFTEKGFMSTSAIDTGAEGFYKNKREFVNYEMRLKPKTAVPINGFSDIPNEQEVLHAPGTKWQITRRERWDDSLFIIYMEEI